MGVQSMVCNPEIHLVPLGELETFYNHNHGKGGRFSSSNSSSSDKVTSHRDKDETAVLQRVSTATKSHNLTGGHSGATVELLSGPKGKVILKGGMTKASSDADLLASKVGKALDAPVPVVTSVGENKIAMEFVNGTIAGGFSKGIGRFIPIDRAAQKSVVNLKGARELAMLDIAIHNVDRHGGNIIVLPGGKAIEGIDHGLAFNPPRVINPATPLETHYDKQFTKSDYENAIKKLAPLHKDFVKAGREDWFQGMNARLQDHAQRAAS